MSVVTRASLAAFALCVWFLTLTGGWTDLHRAIARGLEDRSVLSAGSQLIGTVLTDDHDLGMPTRLVVAGDELVVLDRYRTEPIVAVDRYTGRLLRSFGSEGDGPGEFRSPVALIADESRVAILDVGLNRITWLASRPHSFELLTTTQLQLESAATDFVLTMDRDFLVSGFLAKGQLARLDADGALLGYEGNPTSLENLPRERQIEALQRSVRASPTGQHVVRTSRFAPDLEIVDGRTFATVPVESPGGVDSRRGDRETRFGYLDATAFDDGFMALYSGRTRRSHPGRANYGSVVHRFGWDGRIVAEYHLDADVIAIAWSQEDQLLYAVRHEPVPQIVSYAGLR